MPSPFPGMDPYLEHPARWPSVHSLLIAAIGTRLNALLPPNYVATFGERLYVVESDREIAPDVFVLDRSRGGPAAIQPSGESQTGVVLAPDPPWTIALGEGEEVRESYITIVPADDETRVVTAIEVLSPSNKAAGSQGRKLYLAKQEEVLGSSCHLLEVDLLRGGEHTVAAPVEALIRRGYWNYLACLSRAGRRGHRDVWGILLRDRLPRLAVPLAGDDPDVTLDLQELIDRVYDEGAFARRIDYRNDPPLPLRPEDAEWADRLLHAVRLRG